MVRRMYPRLLTPGGHVPPGCRHVLVEQLGHRDVRVGLPPALGHREPLAELDLRGPNSRFGHDDLGWTNGTTV